MQTQNLPGRQCRTGEESRTVANQQGNPAHTGESPLVPPEKSTEQLKHRGSTYHRFAEELRPNAEIPNGGNLINCRQITS